MKKLRTFGFLITLTALSATFFASVPAASASGPRQCDVEQTECTVPDQPPATPVAETTPVPVEPAPTSAVGGAQVATANTYPRETATAVEVEASVPTPLVTSDASEVSPTPAPSATPEATPGTTIAPPAEQTPPANQHNLLYGALTSVALTAGGLIVRLLLI